MALHLNLVGEPPSNDTADALEGMRVLAADIRRGAIVNSKKLEVILKAIESTDDLTVAVAFTCLTELKSNDAAKSKLDNFLQGERIPGSLSAALVSVHKTEARIRGLPLQDQAREWEKICSTSDDMYLRIEAAKKLGGVDTKKSIDVLRRMAAENSAVSSSASHLLRRIASKQGYDIPDKSVDFENRYYYFEHFSGTLFFPRWIDSLKPISNVPDPTKAAAEKPSIAVSPESSPLPATPVPKPVAPTGNATSSTPWGIIATVLVAAITLFWLFLKKQR